MRNWEIILVTLQVIISLVSLLSFLLLASIAVAGIFCSLVKEFRYMSEARFIEVLW